MKVSRSRLSWLSACVLFLVSFVKCDEIVINLHTSPSQTPSTSPEVRRPQAQTNHGSVPASSAPVPVRVRPGGGESQLSTASSEVVSLGDFYGGTYYDDGYLPAAPMPGAVSYSHSQNYVGDNQHVYQHGQHPEYRPQAQVPYRQHQQPRQPHHQKYHPKQPYHLRPQKQRVSHGHAYQAQAQAQDAYYSPAETHAEYADAGYGGYGAGSETSVAEGVEHAAHEGGHVGPIPVPIEIHTEASSDYHAPEEQHYYSSPVEASHSHAVGWNWVKDIELGEFALLFIPAALLTLVYIFYVAANSPNNAHSKYFIDQVGGVGPPISQRRPSYSYPQHRPSYPQQQGYGGGIPNGGGGGGSGGGGNADLAAMQGGGPPPELANLLNQIGMPSHPSQFGASGPHSTPPNFGRSLAPASAPAVDRLTQRVHAGIEKGEAMNKH